MTSLPDDGSIKHQAARIEGELPSVSGEPHVRLPIPAREQSTLESLSSAFRGLGSMTRASAQPSRTVTYASFSPTSPTFNNNLMLSDDDGGPDEGIYGNRLSIDLPGNEHVVWSGWDEVWWNGQNTPSRLLLLGYRGGIQVWDCTHEQVREVLNLLSPTIGGTVIGAAIIPVSSQDDLLSEERPLLGILTSRPDELLIYSLRTHAILKRIPFNSPHAIQASDQFVVISTVAPPALHILNSVTFDHLSTIAAPHVALPVFALSRRVLAYASAPPPPSVSPTPTPSTASPSKVQADISMAIEGARKVGVGVWSGVKSLLGETNTRANTRAPAYSPAMRSPTPMSPPLLGSPRMYSRSAPSESSYSSGSPLPRVTLSATGEPRPTASQGHVTVVDLEPLLSGGQTRRIVQHHATPGQAVSVLAFSRVGNLLAVTGADGIFVRIFELRPKGRYSVGGPHLTKRDELNELEERDTGSLWHWYDLQRGLTRRRVTNIVWSADSKWIAVVTVRGTLHIFAINPYGGTPSGASHLLGSGRVANMSEPPRAPISLSPILRIHMSTTITTSDNQPQLKGVPVTATFGRPSKPDRESGAQDIFVLNRATGELMLRQCVVRMQSASAIERSMQASMSLPSALSNSVAGTGVSALSSMMRGGVGTVVGEKTGEDLVLGGAEALGKTWGIVRREKEWGEVRRTVERVAEEKRGKKAKSTHSEWLAQAEISTCTRSLKLLPGPIYLSHQFAFFRLCQDWEALLQQSHFNLPATKIIVRREVSARPIADSGSEGAFIGSGTDDMFAASSSLDATLASAIDGSLSPGSASKAQQIPSFPNAYSGGKSINWNDPVRRLSRLSDGLGHGLGSLKREIGKVRPPSGPAERRSPKSPPAVETAPGIKLEFDDDALFEVDEDLPSGHMQEPVQGGLRPLHEDDASRSAESGTGSVPSTVPDMTMLTSPELAGDWSGEGDSFGGEEEEYIHAEGDRFEDDLVVGLMDEEEEERRVIMENAASMKKKHKKKR
ncbi:unnamed protein product [Rhizoctonia solani]|uniref:BCAS3 WD40 domain-containing protein n=1 Tax=Rhizoctonia solani TaxID=456999 RepID=A0A8H3E5T5_9AGAM|nr:unnamed protein product [Rhizoctonia solani]